MLLRNLAIAAALCATSIQAFAPPATSIRVQTARNLMTAKEIQSIISEAEACAAGECALDEVEGLITNLLAQQSQLSKRIAEIDGLIKELEHVNGRDNRPTDEIRETVRAIFRIFAMGVSSSTVTICALSCHVLHCSYITPLLCFAVFDFTTIFAAVVFSFLIQYFVGQGQWKRLPLAFQAYGLFRRGVWRRKDCL
jgi:hypothetical protein